MERLRERLSDRDLWLLHVVRQFRLLDGSQLARLGFGDTVTARRAANRCLQRLVGLRLLVRLPRRIGGVRAGSAGFVYAIGPVGDRLVGSATRRRVGHVSDGFLHHTLAIAELYVQAVLDCRVHGGELLHVAAEPQCWRQLEDSSGVGLLKPDLLLVSLIDGVERHAFVEVDRGTEHAPALLRKLRQYELAYRLGVVAVEARIFPRVVWVVPDEHRATLLVRLIESTSGLTAELHVVAIGTAAAVTALLGTRAAAAVTDNGAATAGAAS